jgi:hypothetical protein
MRERFVIHFGDPSSWGKEAAREDHPIKDSASCDSRQTIDCKPAIRVANTANADSQFFTAVPFFSKVARATTACNLQFN